MAELLEYFEIMDERSYHKWCLQHHPDRRPNDPDASRQFQIVSKAWHEKKDAPCRVVYMTQQDLDDLSARVAAMDRRCKACVKGTVSDRCWRYPVVGTEYCFYHQPGTAHTAFVDDHASLFFAASSTMHFDRSDKTCTARLSNNRFCNRFRSEKSLYCRACQRQRPRCNSI